MMNKFFLSMIRIFSLIIILMTVKAYSEVGIQGLPLKPDPPPAIDGQISEWGTVPALWTAETAAYATFGGSSWKGPLDLSARVHLAWRHENLYVAVEVIDDKVMQKSSGKDLYLGDHIELNIDAAPEVEPTRFQFGDDQFVIALSPGNFQNTGDAFNDIPPAAYIYSPSGLSASNIQITSKRTETGYTIEAAIPWKLLAVIDPMIGRKISIEVGISDCDSKEPAQEKMITLLTDPWDRRRDRLINLALAGADGKVPEEIPATALFDKLTIPPGEKREIRFNLPTAPKGKDAVLTYLARLSFGEPAVYLRNMRVLVNGKALDVNRFINKKPLMEINDGRQFSMASGDLFMVYFGKDYNEIDNDPYYGLKNAKATYFEFMVSDLVKLGPNTLIIENDSSEGKYDILAALGKVEYRTSIKAWQKQGPPTGKIPTVEPLAKLNVDYKIESINQSDLAVTLGKEKFIVESRFSTPTPAWVKGSNSYFTFKRQIERKAEAIIVKDTFENLTNENLPIMQRHEMKVPGLKKVWLSGISQSATRSISMVPSNPTSFGITGKSGVGLMPLDDISRVHVSNMVNGESLGIADNQFVLMPMAKHTSEWVIVLSEQPDYYALINASRRLLNVNFPLDFGFAFLDFRPSSIGSWNDRQLADFTKNRDAGVIANTVVEPTYLEGVYYPHSTGFPYANHDYEKEQLARVRKVSPGVKIQSYFHCFLEESASRAKLYPKDALLLSDGRQANYSGQEDMKIFLPTDKNDFGRDIAKTVDFSLDTLGYDGIYWDELEYCSYQYHYGEPWDGCSADINLKSMKIERLKTSVTLISQPLRLSIAKKILARGPLLGNGGPHTRTMMDLHFPRFAETGLITNCTMMQLYSPIALGDHLTEKTEVDCYKWMLNALNYGCVYHWYYYGIKTTHKTITEYMFPITPMELHEGYIIGNDRIITNRSGLYGWGDKSGHEVHVFNAEGKQVPGFKAPTIKKNGKTYTELRIGEGWSAAILRK